MGLTFVVDSGAAQISVRGVGTGYSGTGLEGSVAIYVDDTYYSTQVGAVQSMLDIRQVQVLKGPQGTLYGRNATGGAVILSTFDPIQGETSGKITASYGNLDYKSIEGVVNLPLSSTVAIRLAGKYSERDGYIYNIVSKKHIGNYDEYLLRGKIAWEPSAAFDAVAKIEYYRRRADDEPR